MTDFEVSVQQEIANVSAGGPHVVLLGAGASRAALPKGDRNGQRVPLLREVSDQLNLRDLFPLDLRSLTRDDFEAAYSQLHDRDPALVEKIDVDVRAFFQSLVLPDEATIYDQLVLCLRPKDAIFTFNWDPFLVQAYQRAREQGVDRLPRLHFLHGNVAIGYCPTDERPGLIGNLSVACGGQLSPSPLMYPVEHKNYQDGALIEHEWRAVREALKATLFFTILGYSAPKTDVEAIGLLREGWGEVEERQFEQTEIVNRPGADEEALRATWDRFIHTHHYEIHNDFAQSWLANHPRRSIEAYWSQYIEAKFIDYHPIPATGGGLEELVAWFQPLLDAEN